MYAQELRDSYQDFRHGEDEGDSDRQSSAQFRDWWSKNCTDTIAISDLGAPEPIDEEEGSEPLKTEGSGDPMIEDDNIDDADDDEGDPLLHYRGSQRIIPLKATYRGAD